jgi:hypothetical protein
MTIQSQDYLGMSDDALDTERAAQELVEQVIELLRLDPSDRLSLHVWVVICAEFSELCRKQLTQFADAILDDDLDIEDAIHDYAPSFTQWNEKIQRARNP